MRDSKLSFALMREGKALERIHCEGYEHGCEVWLGRRLCASSACTNRVVRAALVARGIGVMCAVSGKGVPESSGAQHAD